MAKLVLSPLVTSMRGKIGNGIAQVWKGIQTLRQMPAVITNPQSAAQAKMRERLGVVYAAWAALAQADKDTWGEMAQLVGGYDLPPGGIDNLIPKLGGQMSGFNCFISFAMAALTIGAAVPTSAPLGEQRPTPPLNVAASYATPTLTITFTDPAVKESLARVRLWLRSRKGIYHKQYIGDLELAIETIDLTAARGALGKSIAFLIPEASAEEEVVVQMDTVNPSGLRSMPSNNAVEVLD